MILTIRSGHESGPVSCRDKGRGGVDEGALCLSWLGDADPFASHNPLTKRGATRTATRPPLTLTSTPCPYRTGRDVFWYSPIRLAKFIRTLGAPIPPFGWQNSSEENRI